MANINDGGGGGRNGLWRLGSSQNRLMSEYFNRCLPADDEFQRGGWRRGIVKTTADTYSL